MRVRRERRRSEREGERRRSRRERKREREIDRERERERAMLEIGLTDIHMLLSFSNRLHHVYLSGRKTICLITP